MVGEARSEARSKAISGSLFVMFDYEGVIVLLLSLRSSFPSFAPRSASPPNRVKDTLQSVQFHLYYIVTVFNLVAVAGGSGGAVDVEDVEAYCSSVEDV